MRLQAIIGLLLAAASALGLPSAAEAQRRPAQSGSERVEIQLPLVIAQPSFGQRFSLGLVGGLALGAASRLISDEPEVLAVSYVVGAIAGISAANARLGSADPLPAALGVAVGALPLVAAFAIQGDDEILPGLLAIVAAVTIPIGGATAYELRR